jgi:hypothetical protein
MERTWRTVRERVDFGGLGSVLGDSAETGKSVDSVNVHRARSADTLSARSSESQSRVHLVLDLDLGVVSKTDPPVTQFDRTVMVVGLTSDSPKHRASSDRIARDRHCTTATWASQPGCPGSTCADKRRIGMRRVEKGDDQDTREESATNHISSNDRNRSVE